MLIPLNVADWDGPVHGCGGGRPAGVTAAAATDSADDATDVVEDTEGERQIQRDTEIQRDSERHRVDGRRPGTCGLLSRSVR